MDHKTIFEKDFKIIKSDFDFNYQRGLTERLDADQRSFDQNKLNEIVLWKVNRYADFDVELISLINTIDALSKTIDLNKTERILRLLLKTKGVQLPMASTILRFRNPFIYQIIDQRVYRMIYEERELKLNNYLSDKNLDYQINLYFQYLRDLKSACSKLNIPFEKSDRVLFTADKRINKGHKLKNNG